MESFDLYLTVEEAATRLGVSVATVRRMAGDGRLRARKSGKQWIIEAASLPGRRRPRGSTRSPIDLEKALRHVRQTDLTEQWVPDVLRFEDFLADPTELLSEAQMRLDGSSPDPAVEVDVDKTPFFTRGAVLLTLEDRVAYQAVVESVADRIESATPTSVFSARLSTDPRYFLKHGPKQWLLWRRRIREDIEAGFEWMIKTDLTAYFDHIPHRGLVAEFQALNPDPRVLNSLNEMLRTWTTVPGIGLPQGPNASRMLANLYLFPVDRAMLAAGHSYYRFMDDVRIVAKTKAQAIAGIRLFERECRARGLIVSSGKTQLLHGSEALDDLADDADLSAVEYFMAINATTFARRTLKRILRRALKGDGHIILRDAKFSLWRLALLRESGVLSRVLKRLEDLAPIASIVAAYLRPFISRKRVVESLGKFLADPERSYSTFLVTWLFAAMLEHPGRLPSAWADEAARRVKDRNQPSYLRAVAAIVMARGGRAADATWIRADVDREYDRDVLRGYAVGLHWVGALDRLTERRLVKRAPQLQRTVDYLRGRTTLPSLVYKQTSRLRVT